MRTLKELAEEAIQVQDACNPLGLSKGFARAVQELRERLAADELPDGTDAVCTHPIFRLWCSKFHEMARMGLSDLYRYGKVYSDCKRLAGREEEVTNG